MSKQIEIYQSDDGSLQLEIAVDCETLWLSQAQLAELFEKDVRTVNEHIKNIYQSGELEKEATIRKFQIVRKEGSRNIKRQITHDNMDVVTK